MKKICIVSPEFPPRQWGGLARTVGKVAIHARDMGLQVHVAHFSVIRILLYFLMKTVRRWM